jgi:hypothetical protein
MVVDQVVDTMPQPQKSVGGKRRLRQYATVKPSANDNANALFTYAVHDCEFR